MKNSFLLAVIGNFANPSKSTSSSVDLSDLSVDYAQTMTEATVIQMESKLRQISSPNNDYLGEGRDYRYLGQDKNDIGEDEFYLGEDKNEIAPIVSKIIGGTTAEHGRYNYMAHLRTNDERECGGMLIAPNLILTAAHCGSGFDTADLGMYDIRTSNGSERIPIIKEIAIKNHDPKNAFNSDFMILVLKSDSNFQPVCLADKNFKKSLKAGDMLHALGFGITNYNDKSSYSNTLEEASLKYIKNKKCSKIYSQKYQYKVITKNMMCTDSGDEGRDACRGDSGGPLIQKNGKGKDVAVGVISWGLGCAEHPGVYGAIGKVHRWIKKKAKKNGGWDITQYCSVHVENFELLGAS
mmetsp:Transcript_21542/g.43193  ORF Transcript_21542/g.43193 Transcript_21542/m.43193 type:complete len:352 (-) Transcript_21542:223-1278(-)